VQGCNCGLAVNKSRIIVTSKSEGPEIKLIGEVNVAGCDIMKSLGLHSKLISTRFTNEESYKPDVGLSPLIA